MVGRLLGHLRHHAVAFLALAIALGGTSYAVTSKPFAGANGRLHACVKSRTGTVRLVVAGQKCHKREQRVTWNRRGRRGKTGATGPVGPRGLAGPAGSIAGAPAGGALTGTYPNPSIAAAQAPRAITDNPSSATDPCAPSAAVVELTLCGTSTQHWVNGGFGLTGLSVWRDRTGEVHIRGSATVSSGNLGNAPVVFVLPPALRPVAIEGFPILTGQTAGNHQAGDALLVLYPTSTPLAAGDVSVFIPSKPTDTVIHIGEITYRTDA